MPDSSPLAASDRVVSPAESRENSMKVMKSLSLVMLLLSNSQLQANAKSNLRLLQPGHGSARRSKHNCRSRALVAALIVSISSSGSSNSSIRDPPSSHLHIGVLWHAVASIYIQCFRCLSYACRSGKGSALFQPQRPRPEGGSR